MGRWAQSRHRGRGNCGGDPFTLPAPVFDTEWSLETGGGSVFGNLLVVLPDGSDGIESESWIDPDGFREDVIWTDTTQQLTAEQPDGELINVKTRWTMAGVAVSPWSDTQQIAVVDA